MLTFILGISITINILLSLIIYIYLKTQKITKSLGGLVEDEKTFKDFFTDNNSYKF